MKFAQVPVGQRFELQGGRYLKTSPVVAVEEASGRSRFIGKYVEVTLPEGPDQAKPAPASSAPVDPQAVLAEFEAFHARCLAILDGLQDSLDVETLDRARTELEEARRRFVKRIEDGAAE